MATIHLHRTTSVTAEQYIAALTYFGPGRSKLFGNSADEYLKVHQRSLSEADVTEGSGGVWECLVGSSPCHTYNHRLQCMGRLLGTHLHFHPPPRR